MKTRERNFQTMCNAVQGTGRLFYAIISSSEKFLEAFTLFEELLDKIIVEDGKANSDYSGQAKAKKISRSLVMDGFTNLSYKLRTLATFTKDTLLKQEASYKLRAFKRMKEDELSGTCQRLLDLAQANLTALEPYEITSDDLTELSENLGKFRAFIGKPALSRTLRKEAIIRMRSYIAEARILLNDTLDLMMFRYKDTEPLFHKAWFVVRKIIDVHGQKAMLSGVVTDAETKAPLHNVIISVSGMKAKRKTSKGGKFNYKRPPEGEITLTAILKGYNSVEMKTEIKDGEPAKVEVEMEVKSEK